MDYLSECDEASESDLAEKLGIPMNTVEYNIKKLLKSGFVEKAKNFFWSKRGKKIDMYKLAKKHIIISHKGSPSMSKVRSVLPVVLIAGAFAFVIRKFYQINSSSSVLVDSERVVGSAMTSVASGGASEVAQLGANTAMSFADKMFALPAWVWFLAGTGVGVLVLLGLNWRKL